MAALQSKRKGGEEASFPAPVSRKKGKPKERVDNTPDTISLQIQEVPGNGKSDALQMKSTSSSAGGSKRIYKPHHWRQAQSRLALRTAQDYEKVIQSIIGARPTQCIDATVDPSSSKNLTCSIASFQTLLLFSHCAFLETPASIRCSQQNHQTILLVVNCQFE